MILPRVRQAVNGICGNFLVRADWLRRLGAYLRSQAAFHAEGVAFVFWTLKGW